MKLSNIKILSLAAAAVWMVLLGSCSRKTNGGGEGISYSPPRSVSVSDIWVPPGYKIEAIATALDLPKDVVFDEDGKMYILESGFYDKEHGVAPRLLRYEGDLSYSTIAIGDKNGTWTGIDYYQKHFYISESGKAEDGKILKISKEGRITTVLEGLPSRGDYGTNDIVIKDGYIYFTQGSATNSGVMGQDNLARGQGREYYDIPCEDVILSGQNYKTSKKDKTLTGAYAPYGSTSRKGEVVKGKLPCTGSIMRIPVEGGDPELVAWGFRNPNGMAFSLGGDLYVSENGYAERGSRPFAAAADYLWKVQTGQWYGFPDYTGGQSLDSKLHRVSKKISTAPVLDTVPNEAPQPVSNLGLHTTASDLAFSSTNSFGYPGDAFVALYGDLSPWESPLSEPAGFKVVRVNVNTGEAEDFIMNQDSKGQPVTQPASKLGSKGMERPVGIRFSSLDREMYIIDHGVMKVGPNGPQPVRSTGVIWKVRKLNQ